MYEAKNFSKIIDRIQSLNLKEISKDDIPEIEKHLHQVSLEISTSLIDVETFLQCNEPPLPGTKPSESAMAGHLLVNAGNRILALTEHALQVEAALETTF